ncbi:MAG: hypothetical protein R3C28_03925 [Pirellulaceae bacterium]
MHGKGITNEGRFVEQTLSTIREFMEADEQAFAYQKFIAPASSSVIFAKSLNRSVTGSMNDSSGSPSIGWPRTIFSPHDVGFELNDILLSALATTKSQVYGRPNEAFKAMLTSHSDNDETRK